MCFTHLLRRVAVQPVIRMARNGGHFVTFKWSKTAVLKESKMEDETLDVFGYRIRSGLEMYLFERTDRVYWEQNNKFRYRNVREVNQVLEEAFDIMYTMYPSIERVLDENLVLLQQCTWVGMNVPWPVDPDDHIQRVIDNLMEVFNTTVYANLRCEILNLDYEAHSKL